MIFSSNYYIIIKHHIICSLYISAIFLFLKRNICPLLSCSYIHNGITGATKIAIAIKIKIYHQANAEQEKERGRDLPLWFYRASLWYEILWLYTTYDRIKNCNMMKKIKFAVKQFFRNWRWREPKDWRTSFSSKRLRANCARPYNNNNNDNT